MKPTMKTYLRLFALLIGVVVLAESQAADAIKRYTLLEDKFRTVEMFRAPGHDFFIDLSVWLNSDVQDVVDEAETVSKMAGTESEKIKAASAFLNKYDKTEQTLRFNVDFGVPIFKFSLFGTKIIPEFRFGGGLGVHIGIESKPLTFSDLPTLLSSAPQQVVDAVANCTQLEPLLVGGADIVGEFIDNTTCGDGPVDAQAEQYRGDFFWSELNVPNLFPFVKAEAYAGLLINWIKGEHWFGSVNIYALGRSDASLRVTADTVAKNAKTLDLPDEANLTINATSDLKVGYTNRNLTGFFSINEIKLATVSDNKEKGGEVFYGFNPLFRLHGEYKYELAFLDLKPFVGLHKRSAYSLADGLYVGAEVASYLWGDRLGLMVRGMLDTEHFTFTPRMKIWFTQLEYNLKLPIKSEVDGLKPSTLHSLNFRMFF